MAWLRQDIGGLPVHLEISRRGRRIVASIGISKAPETDPIREESLAVLLFAEGGALLTPVQWPEPGLLPEAITRGATAYARYEFEAPAGTKLARGIVVLRGDHAEYRLGGR
jgi:hypothetical protein